MKVNATETAVGSPSFTFDRDFGLAELTAGVVGGLAEVIAGVVSGGRADVQTGRPVREADPGAAGGRQFLPVLHPLDLQRGGAADVTPETQLVALVHRHRLERDVKHRRLLGLCRRDDDGLVFSRLIWDQCSTQKVSQAKTVK